MDKRIVDKLVKFGLITNVGVDASKYKDVEDLIAKGIITVPGARDKINELLEGLVDVEDITPEQIDDDKDNTLVLNPEPQPINEVINEVTNEDLDDNSPVIDETPESEPVIDETPKTTEPIVDTPETIDVYIETPEVVEPELVVEETTEVETTKKTRKSKKEE